MTRGVPLRALVLAIRGYRRYLSGRGPLRRVRCTFHATESCSAYGLRAAEELATSLPHAVRLIRARIRACRCTSIYRFERTGRGAGVDRGLGWERDHELPPAALAAQLAARGERADTTAQVLAARTLVATWRGDRIAHATALQLLGVPARASELQARSGRAIPIRAGDAAIRHHRRVMWRGLALALASVVAGIVLAGVGSAPPAMALAMIVPFVASIGAAAGGRGSARRLERQRVASRFLRPRVAVRQHDADAAAAPGIEASWTSWYSAREAGSAGWSPAS